MAGVVFGVWMDAGWWDGAGGGVRGASSDQTNAPRCDKLTTSGTAVRGACYRICSTAGSLSQSLLLSLYTLRVLPKVMR